MTRKSFQKVQICQQIVHIADKILPHDAKIAPYNVFFVENHLQMAEHTKLIDALMQLCRRRRKYVKTKEFFS